MNEIINMLLLAKNKFIPEMHLRYTACGPFTKSKEKIKKFKETGNSRYIYQKQLST